MTKKYYEKLPRRVRTTAKCQILSSDGSRCQNKAYAEVDAHLDEMYDYDARWVFFLVCKKHAEDLGAAI